MRPASLGFSVFVVLALVSLGWSPSPSRAGEGPGGSFYNLLYLSCFRALPCDDKDKDATLGIYEGGNFGVLNIFVLYEALDAQTQAVRELAILRFTGTDGNNGSAVAAYDSDWLPPDSKAQPPALPVSTGDQFLVLINPATSTYPCPDDLVPYVNTVTGIQQCPMIVLSDVTSNTTYLLRPQPRSPSCSTASAGQQPERC